MTLRLEKINPLHDAAWDEQISAHPAATIFHTSAWARVLSDTYQHRPVYLRATIGDSIAALIPLMEVRSPFTGRRAVSLPFSDFCQALIFEPTAVAELSEQIYRLARVEKWSYFELRGGELTGSGTPASEVYYAHHLPLAKDIASTFANFDPANQRAIRKADRSGLAITINNDQNAMNDFVRLHELTRRRHGVPPQPRGFFAALQRYLLASDRGFIVTARDNRRAVAAFVFLLQSRKAIYKFGASDPAAQELRPNNIAMWAGIKELTGRGITSLHLGRTDLGQEGLRRFKNSWGTQESKLSYYKFDLSTGAWASSPASAGRPLVNQFFRRLPLSVNRLVGALTYPHLD